MHILEKLRETAAAALAELQARPWLPDFPMAKQLDEELGHALGDYDDTVVPRPTHRAFLDGMDARLFPGAESAQTFIRIGKEREMLREVAHMIPVWIEYRKVLARDTVLDNFTKITRVRTFCKAITEQEFVAPQQ